MSSIRRSVLALACAVGVSGLSALPAHAVGCVSGAVAGAVAGHVARHHAVLGAMGGCIVGHELAVRKKRIAEANRLIADYDTAPAGSTRQKHDLIGIEKLARKHVAVAVKWEQAHRAAH